MLSRKECGNTPSGFVLWDTAYTLILKNVKYFFQVCRASSTVVYRK